MRVNQHGKEGSKTITNNLKHPKQAPSRKHYESGLEPTI
jgi:hypothetical protein